MQMTESQKRFFYEEGYVKVSGAVPRVMVDAARQTINAEMGKGNSNPFPDINSTPMITDLFNDWTLNKMRQETAPSSTYHLKPK